MCLSTPTTTFFRAGAGISSMVPWCMVPHGPCLYLRGAL
jgi:hypothetical protein